MKGKNETNFKKYPTKFKSTPVKYSVGIVKYRRNTNFPLLQFGEMTTAYNSCSWVFVVLVCFILSMYIYSHSSVY